MHRDMVSGKIATMKVDSMEQANQAIAAFAGDFPQLSEPPEAHTMSCCMRNVGNKKLACVLLNNGVGPITMVVANTDAVQTPSVPATVHASQTYNITANRGQPAHGHVRAAASCWICLIHGELSSDKLAEPVGRSGEFSAVP